MKPTLSESDFFARQTPGVLDVVKHCRVGIAGVGGLGSNAALMLTRLGVGTLVIADFDIVEPSNLNRQNYRTDQIGQSKVAATTENLRAISPFTQIIPNEIRLTRTNFSATFKGCDAVLECFDAKEAKRLAYSIARTEMRDTPFVLVSGLAGLGNASGIRETKLADNAYLIGDEVAIDASDAGIVSPRVMIAAAMQVSVVLRLLMANAAK